MTTTASRLEDRTVHLLGVPLDENSSFLRGAAEGPGRIREALFSGASNLCCESGLDLEPEPRFRDAGDVAPGQGDEALERIEAAAGEILAEGGRLLSLGGDHSVSWPLVRAHARHFGPLQILHLDAHPDLYDELDGSRRSHACPFARILEEGLASRLIQVGIRTLNPHQRAQAERFGVEIVEMRRWHLPELDPKAPTYLSLDLDVFDPAFAPGVAHHEAGGATPRQVLELIQELPVTPIGADLVELLPARDPVGITAALAAKLVKEVAGRMLSG